MTVASGSLGGRLSRSRRHRIAYLALLRRSSAYTIRAWALRVVCIGVVATLSLVVFHSALGTALALLASAGSVLLWVNERHLRHGTQPRFWLTGLYLRNQLHTDGRHRLGLGSYIEIPEACLLTAIPAWVTTGEPVWARLVMLTAAMAFMVSTSLLIYNDHTWFNPDEPNPPTWHEISRLLAGPVTALPVCAIALPADWGPQGTYAAVVICLIPLTVSLRISDTDLIMRPLPDLVQEEAHAGRELVISETHGALSTNLRLLEQHAREVRASAPTLYELAVSANSRLRETLTLSRIGHDSSTSVQNLEAPVRTLARAVGAKATVDITVTTLSPSDRDLARLVLNDLVGNALNAGAAEIGVHISPDGDDVVISVTDDAPPMAPGVWKTPGTSSAWLEGRLGGVAGSLIAVQQAGAKTVTARWRTSDE